MPDITITFNEDLNTLVSVNDIAYYTTPAELGGFENNSAISDVVKMGAITDISGKTITIDCANNVTVPTTNDFILFSKNNAQEMSSISGYYAEVKFKNDSTEEAELFRITLEAVESSK